MYLLVSSELKQLNIEATVCAKQYMARFAWPTVLLVLFVVSSFMLNLSLFQHGILPSWLALLNLSILTYIAYTPLHEAVHGNINGRYKGLKWLNQFCGFIVAPIIAIPFTSHRFEHMAHHGFTNQKDKDPDIIMQGMKNGPWAVVSIAIQFLWIQNTYFFKYQWSKQSITMQMIYCIEVLVSLSWRVVFIVWMGTVSALIVVILGYLVGGIFTAYWFAYRPHYPYEDEQRYKNTASLIMPKWMRPLEWFWFGQNLHSIHHLFPRIPFYFYHRVHRKIEPIMRAHGASIIGIYNRKKNE